jgi:hypothetical protein
MSTQSRIHAARRALAAHAGDRAAYLSDLCQLTELVADLRLLAGELGLDLPTFRRIVNQLTAANVTADATASRTWTKGRGWHNAAAVNAEREHLAEFKAKCICYAQQYGEPYAVFDFGGRYYVDAARLGARLAERGAREIYCAEPK